MKKKENVPDITVIMPSLNVGKYIKICMDSVLNQSFSNIEVLAVDAGSTDGTLEILCEYARNDDRVRVIVSDKKSYGYQINLGIQQARGNYISIVETDDKISSDMFIRLFECAQKTDADYVKGAAQYYIEINEKVNWSINISLPVDKSLIGCVLSPCSRPDLLVSDIYLWNGLYKRSFLKDIKLNETPGAAFQDQGFLLQTISRAKRAVYLDCVVYSYRQDNSNSSIFNPKGFHFIVQEYSLNKKYLSDLDIMWTKSFYIRMLNQAIGRFQIMALSSCYNNEVDKDIELIREQLKQAVRQNILTEADIEKNRWEQLCLWFKRNENIFNKHRELIKDKSENIRMLLNSVKQKKVVIFGAKNSGRFIHLLLESRKSGAVQAYADNDSSLQNKELQGIDVFAPEEAVKIYPSALYVISSNKYADEIKEQLKNLGVGDEQIFIYSAGINFNLLRLPETE